MGQWWVEEGVGAEVYLGVVSVSVEVEVEVAEDLTKGEDVDEKSKRPSTESWGTPCVTAAESEVWPLRAM